MDEFEQEELIINIDGEYEDAVTPQPVDDGDSESVVVWEGDYADATMIKFPLVG